MKLYGDADPGFAIPFAPSLIHQFRLYRGPNRGNEAVAVDFLGHEQVMTSDAEVYFGEFHARVLWLAKGRDATMQFVASRWRPGFPHFDSNRCKSVEEQEEGGIVRYDDTDLVARERSGPFGPQR